MPFQPVPGVASVEMTYLQGEQRVQNVFHVHTSELWGAEFLENLALEFRDWHDDTLAATQSVDVDLILVQVRDLSEEFAGYFEVSIPGGAPGSKASPVLPGNVTCAMKWTTGLTGRSTRGRTYHIGLTEADVVDSMVGSTSTAALVSAYTNLMTRIAAAETAWDLVVVSRVQNGVTLSEGLHYVITAVSTDGTVDSQRRRLVGRGT